MRRTLMFSAPLLAVLAACGTRPAPTPASGSPGTGGAAPSPPPATRATLASEAARLAELFAGTPVVFAMQPDGSLRVTVPRKNSFDPGSIKVRPALGAVLERLARSPAAPPDVESRNSVLARERALSVRDYLIGQGVGVARLQAAGAVLPDQVEIVLTA
jgi:flagellar motor protein MotB